MLRRCGTANARRSDLLHRFGDLLRILQRSDAIAKIFHTRH